MKRIALLVLGCMVLTISSVMAQKKMVVSSASIFHDMAMNVGGDLFDYQMIVPVGGDPHLHEPKPSDARLVSSADLILINGMTFEGWINELIENSGTKAKVVTITENVNALKSEKYSNSVDPHAWMSIPNARIYIKNISAALKEQSPGDSSVIEANYKRYDKQLGELDSMIRDQIKQIPEAKRILITSHDAFNYYGQEYGLEMDAILGLSTEAEIQTSDIRRINKAITDRQIPAIFVESTINPKVMKQIAKDNDVRIGGELFADSLGDNESSAATYIDMMTSNTNAIVDGLMGKNLSNNVADEKSIDTTDDEESNSYVMYAILAGLLIIVVLFLAQKLK